MSNGIIKQCKNQCLRCHYKCCTFTTNFIVLYPGEYEKAEKDKSHLKIVDENYHGGKKAVCTKLCTADNFKPLDCQSYPLFPLIDSASKLRLIRGSKCPLTSSKLKKHEIFVIKTWNKLLQNNKTLDWLKEVKLVGYQLYDE